ncbi:carnitine dehydratase [Rhizobacter sp. Root16D2]|nr:MULTISPECIES: CoA transferase [unclassified Rhizobacter]KQU67173.1 carnitine dehydratase [Rhizobacter sp. Root29]KQV98116.1 carnitine dehydratase [Rhizobacter sp. Root1238]KRB02014.1 carnitine dehydratase [Rhizobacter sp. Root16D2]
MATLWQQAGLPAAGLDHLSVPGNAPVLPSSFAVADAIQASMAAAAGAAAELWHLHQGRRQRVLVPREHAVLESCAHFTLDGRAPQVWDKLSGLYPCGHGIGAPGWVRIHANFAHHRDGALKLLGCPVGERTERAAVEQALRGWRADDVEDAAAQAGLVVAALRSFDEWDRHPQALALAGEPTVRIDRIGGASPIARPPSDATDRPLHGLRVLDLTRILAGPVAGRTLAAYGAEVLLLNAPHLPNIEGIAETSRGKRSAQLDLREPTGRERLKALLADAHVFLQGYRPGGLAALGFGPAQLAALRPGIVAVSLSAYGASGPWATRRGFDSLVQTATGFNDAEARAAGAAKPQALPLQALDYAAGYLLAFGTQAALWRQAQEGGSWHVQVSLAGVGRWLRSLGRVDAGLSVTAPEIAPWLVSEPSGFGRLVAARHAAQFSDTPPLWRWPSMPPGTHDAAWAA